MNRYLRTLSISAFVLTTIGAVGCTSTVDTGNPDDTTNPTNPTDEPGGTGKTEEALACSLADRTCYHEWVGHSWGTKWACNQAGFWKTGNAYGFLCIPSQPSGRYYLYIWSPTCPRGRTWQQC
jgi:hypothetical protein